MVTSYRSERTAEVFCPCSRCQIRNGTLAFSTGKLGCGTGRKLERFEYWDAGAAFFSTVSLHAKWFDAGSIVQTRDPVNRFVYSNAQTKASIKWKSLRRGEMFEALTIPAVFWAISVWGRHLRLHKYPLPWNKTCLVPFKVPVEFVSNHPNALIS